MKILIVPNFDKENATFCTRKVCQKLLDCGAEVLFGEEVTPILQVTGANYANKEKQLDKADVILAIGGDGTIIHTAKFAVDTGIPILGINTGRLGFLAGMEVYELGQLERLFCGDYRIDERMMLEVVVENQQGTSRYLALNDAVVAKGALSRMIDMEIYCNGSSTMSYRADGIIFSTPTGSTAYTLSAGGPIVDSELNAIVMTPIAPHSLFDRSILFAPHHVLTLKADSAENTKIYLTVDGEEGVLLTPDASVTIREASQRVKLIDIDETPFYKVLNKKFSTRLYHGKQ